MRRSIYQKCVRQAEMRKRLNDACCIIKVTGDSWFQEILANNKTVCISTKEAAMKVKQKLKQS